MRAFALALVLATGLAFACSSSSSNDPASGGSGGSGGATGGNDAGGAAGSAGAPSDAGGDADAAVWPNVCKLECQSNDDCKGNGIDLGLTCGKSGSCLECTGNTECLRVMSGWLFPCSSDADCTKAGSGWVCIDVDGTGRCAEAAPVSTAEKCKPPAAPDRVTRDRVGTTGTVDVCAHKSAVCDTSDGRCDLSCNDSAFCKAYFPHASVCNSATGRCECGVAADCIGSPLGPVCRDGHCGCDQDGDCDTQADAGTNGSKCVSNVCSCTGVGECKFGKKELDGLQWSCEPVEPPKK
jgi:hypothetical protein